MVSLLAVRRRAPLVYILDDVVVRRGLLASPRRLTLQPIYQLPLNFTKFNGAAAKVAKRKALIAPRRKSRVADRWRRSRAFVWHLGRLHRSATAVATAKKVARHGCSCHDSIMMSWMSMADAPAKKIGWGSMVCQMKADYFRIRTHVHSGRSVHGNRCARGESNSTCQ